MASGRNHPATKALQAYCTQVARRPGTLIGLYSLLLIVIISARFKPLVVETDFASFIKADGDASLRQEAYLMAMTAKDGKDSERRLQAESAGAVHYARKELTVIYEARGGDALSEQVLRDQRDFEQRLRSLPGWRRFCGGFAHLGATSDSDGGRVKHVADGCGRVRDQVELPFRRVAASSLASHGAPRAAC